MHFHKYRNWTYISDGWEYRMTLSDRLIRTWEGECEVCGRPKLRRQVVRKYL